MRLVIAVGARPNAVKVAPLLPEFARAGIAADVAFTGPPEVGLSADLEGGPGFYGIELPVPRWSLDIGAGTDAALTARALLAFEELFAQETPDAVMVVGDVSTALAAAIAASKAGVPVVHLEAGLRCGDLRIPEEVNRVMISRIAAMHLTPTESALGNLEDEGIDPERISFVGSMLAESVLRHLDGLGTRDAAGAFGLEARGYVLGSFHRLENLADAERLRAIVDGAERCGLPVLVPDANGLRRALERAGIEPGPPVSVVDAVSYTDMLALIRDAAAVITDSGGVQQEACMICTPCVTVRDCTEHVATVIFGANELVAADADAINAALARAREHKRSWVTPKRWDRAVSDRVVRAIRRGIEPLA